MTNKAPQPGLFPNEPDPSIEPDFSVSHQPHVPDGSMEFTDPAAIDDQDDRFNPRPDQFYTAALPPEWETLVVPEELNDPYDTSLREMLPALKKGFFEYWEQQRLRIELEGGMVVFDRHNMTEEEQGRAQKLGKRAEELVIVDHAVRQQRFESAVRFAKNVIHTVIDLKEREPESTVVLMYDVDDSTGRVPDSVKGKRFENDEGYMIADFDGLVLNPALPVVTEFLHNRYGNSVSEGLMSTKLQEGLISRLVPRLQKACPGAFRDPRYVISSRDGRFTEQLQTRLTRIRREDVSLNDLLHDRVVAEDGEEKKILPPEYKTASRVLDLGHPDLSITSDEDLKLLILLLLRHESEQPTAGQPIPKPVSFVGVDNWPSFERVLPGHSSIRTVPLKALNAQFYLPEDRPDFWGASGAEYVGKHGV
jgi:hypothetical protein